MNSDEADAAELPSDDYRPWEEVGGIRRDSEPHRGNLLQMLGIVALISGIGSLPTCFCFCFLPFSLMALVFGVLVWVLGNGDLNRMDAGTMDPRGRAQTRLGVNFGRAATIMALVGIVLMAGFWIVSFALQMANPLNSP